MIVLPSARGFSTYNPIAEIATFRTKRSSGTFGGAFTSSVASNSGAFRVNWWDGTTTVYSGGTVEQYVSKDVVAPYDTAAEKEFYITPINSSGQQSGQLTLIRFASSERSPISFIDIKGLSKLETFVCDGGEDLTSYTHNGVIQNLSLTTTGLTSISFPEGSRTSSVTLNDTPSLLTVSGLQNLKRLELFRAKSAGFTSLDFSNFASLYHLDLFGCPLTSLRAQNCTLVSDSYSTYSYFIGGAFINYTNLDRNAIVQFFNDLGNGDGYINVGSATGAASLTPTDILIATAKGYTVLGGGI